MYDKTVLSKSLECLKLTPWLFLDSLDSHSLTQSLCHFLTLSPSLADCLTDWLTDSLAVTHSLTQ